VELALALPAVLVALLLVVQVSLIGRDQLLVVHAAREGARAAALEPTSATAAAAAARAAPGLDARRLTVSTEVEGELVRVQVRYRAPTDVPLVGPLVGDPTLEASVAMRIEAPEATASPP
jgi:Flp pilus assembly protein TadG